MVWRGNWKFATKKKEHLFTHARYRWLVNMWTAYGGRKDLAAISLQRQTMRVDLTFVLTRSKPPYGQQGLAGSWGKDTVRRVHFGVFSRGGGGGGGQGWNKQKRYTNTHFF